MVKSLKELLVEAGLSEEKFAGAEAKAAKEEISLMHAVELLNIVPENVLLDIFSKHYRIAKSNIGEMEIPRNIIDLIPREIAFKFRVLPIDRAGNNIIIATGDPTNLKMVDTIRFKAGYFPKPVLASELRITEALEKYYGKNLDLDAISKKQEEDVLFNVKKKLEAERQEVDGKISPSDGPIVQLVNNIIMQCLQRGASDVHVEPYENILRIRLRIDGVLQEIARPPMNMKAPLIARIKIMACLNIAEQRLPQDGAINVQVRGKPIDFRVSTIPTVYGEKVVMRVLDKSSLNVDLTKLGFEQEELSKFLASIRSPYGMVLVTGPTGSGKTTTLYSALSDLNKECHNIMTAEDPVEYNLEGINQLQVKPEIGLDFSAALRSFLRQDPDIIMVGEIRDLETAEIAIKAALTGHLVFSTLHTNSAADTIYRLLNMGVAGYNLVSALNCVTAQRLVKKICTRCRVVDESVTPEVMIQLGIHPSYARNPNVKAYKGAGCPACLRSGTKGRAAVHEVMKINDALREVIIKNLSVMELKKVAMKTGMKTLRQSALNKMVQGICTAAEVVAVTAADSTEIDVKKVA